MIRNRLISLAAMLASLMIAVAQSLSGNVIYQYWFDNNTDDIISSETKPTAIECGDLRAGLHSIHFFAQRDGVASAVSTQCFLRIEEPEDPTSPSPITYCYWIDNDKDAIVESSSPVTSIEASALRTGLHSVHFFVRRGSETSAVKTACFLRIEEPEDSTDPSPITYCYWIDNDKDAIVESSSPVTTIDASSLRTGLHSVHFFVRRGNEASAVKTACFLRIEEPEDPTEAFDMIVLIDGEYFSSIPLQGREGSYNIPIEMPEVSVGNHTLTVLLASNDGQITSPVMSNFYHDVVEERPSISLTVYDEEDNDVSSEVEYEWRDSLSRILATSYKISGLTEGDSLSYSVILPENLGLIYQDIRQCKVAAKHGPQNLDVHLNRIPLLAFTGHTIGGADITLTQYLNGRYKTVNNVTADSNGNFTIEITNIPTRIDVMASGYNKNSVSIDTPSIEDGISIELVKLGNKIIRPSITYLASTTDGPKRSLMTIDLNRILYSLTDDNNKNIVNGILSDGIIRLPESVTTGMGFNIKLESLDNTFQPTETNVIISDGENTSAEIEIIQKGVIEVHYSTSSAKSYLYDHQGRLVSSVSALNKFAEFQGINEGDYTIISVSDDISIGIVSDISTWELIGLVVGRDYVETKCNVKDGFISFVELIEVPLPKEPLDNVITSRASFTPNKTPIIPDELATGNLILNIPEEVLYQIESGVVELIIPDDCEYVDGSMMVEGKVAAVGYGNGKVSINLNREQLTSRIRMCFKASHSGSFRIGAQLTLNGQSTITLPSGNLSFYVSDYDMTIPQYTASPTILVKGKAAPESIVEVFDDTTLVGTTYANKVGSWETEIELVNLDQSQYHNIRMRSTDTTGFEFSSSPKTCQFDADYIAPVSVTMINTAWGRKEWRSVFSIDGKTIQPKSYDYYYLYPNFTFLIDFTRNDTTKVKAVELEVFTESGSCVVLPTTFDEKQKCWVASAKFFSGNLPYNVDVSYVLDMSKIDMSPIDDLYNEFERTDEEYQPYFDMIAQVENQMLEPKDKIDRNVIQELINNASLKLPSDTLRFLNSNLAEILDRVDGATSIDEFKTLMGEFDRQFSNYLDSLAIYDSTTDEDIYTFSIGDAECPINITFGNKSVTRKTKLLSKANQNNSDITLEELMPLNYRFMNNITGDFLTVDMRDFISKHDESSKNQVVDALTNLSSDISDVSSFTSLYASLNGQNLSEAAKQAKLSSEQWNKLANILSSSEADVNEEILSKWMQATLKSNELSKKSAELSKLSNKFEALGRTADRVGLGISIGTAILDASLNWNNWEALRKEVMNRCSGNTKDDLLAAIKAGEDFERAELLRYNTINASIATLFAGVGLKFATITPQAKIGLFAISTAWLWSNSQQQKRSRESSRLQRARVAVVILESPDCKGGDGYLDDRPTPSRPAIVPVYDPSGIVYEGVISKPIDGVIASIYQNNTSEGFGSLWNAEEYDQINPQQTDSYGMYAWDVPRGYYKVKFEKEGYEPTETSWLPVPPPQLNVNVSMRKNGPAQLVTAYAHPEEVFVEFDTYMDLASLTDDNLYVVVGGRRLDDATIEIVNAEASGDGISYASKLKILPKARLTAEYVTLYAKRPISTYAGVSLDGDIEMRLPVDLKVEALQAPDMIKATYGGTTTLRLRATPAAAAKGKQLKVLSSSPIIASVDDDESRTFDENGYATIIVSGNLPGSSILTFAVESSEIEVTTEVEVSNAAVSEISNPEANVPSGAVARGTKIYLSCATPDVVIYYTTDGSCPCDETANRKIYDGNPITVNSSMTLKVQAVHSEYGESDIVVYSYSVYSGIETTTADTNPSVYPNPVRDILTISAGEAFSWKITSATGVVILSGSEGSTSTSVDVSRLAPGMYVVTISRGNTTDNLRIVKE